MIPTRGGITIACWADCDAWSSRSSIGRRRRRQAAGMPARRERRPKVENPQRPAAARRRDRDRCHWRMATRLGLGVADDNKIRFLGGGVEPLPQCLINGARGCRSKRASTRSRRKLRHHNRSPVVEGKGGCFWSPTSAKTSQWWSRVAKGSQGVCLLFTVGNDKGADRSKPRSKAPPTRVPTPHSLSKEFPQVLRPSPVAPERPSTKSREPTKFSRQPSLLITTAPSSTTTPKTEATHQTHPRLPTFPTK